jgi:competence ComEA-like helix-hairpin-helix protein
MKRANGALGLLLVASFALTLRLFFGVGEVKEIAMPSEASWEHLSIGGGWRGLLVGEPLKVNSATLEDFIALPGVGEFTARSIISTRERLGGFKSLDDFELVSGIGKAKGAFLGPWLEVN